MNIVLQDKMFPLRLLYETPMTDEQFLSFCEKNAKNELLQIERDANGDVMVRLKPSAGAGSCHERQAA